jgi:hypothetical protein
LQQKTPLPVRGNASETDMLTYLTSLFQKVNGDRMGTTYEKIEKLESALQVLRADLLRMRKDLIEVKREFSSEKDFEKLVREASNLTNKGEDIDPTTLIREMRDKDYDW